MTTAFEICLALGGVIASGVIATLWLRAPLRQPQTVTLLPQSRASYLFDDDILHHASDGTDDFCVLEPGFHSWADLYTNVIDDFPSFPSEPPTAEAEPLIVASMHSSATCTLEISRDKHLCRVAVVPATPPARDARSEYEVRLERLAETLTGPVWHTDKQGQLQWWNGSYQTLHTATHPTRTLTEHPLFGSDLVTSPQRLSLRNAETDKRDWYEVTFTELDGVTCYQASCITDLVRAEEARRNFVQTLTKTFAQLSIGLAIFDRDKQLVLFNPALVDLTGLRAEFLSARPTLQTFFDKLRETRKMPEPKNYASWRTAISELVSAANDGRYEETWSLESGQTFRVKGRPHPDGATAFLIEDISAEVSLTRNFRAELEQGQSMLDTLDDGIAVFSASGVLTFSNAAYQQLWQVESHALYDDITIQDAIQNWRRRSAPNLNWSEIEHFVRNFEDRKPWSMPLYLLDGTELACLVSPIVAGATLIRFHTANKTPATRPDAIPVQQDA